jgi:hypothetical protein
MKKNAVLLMFGLLVLEGFLLTSCGKTKTPIKSYESYLFASHDSNSGEWVIIRTDDVDHTKTKIVAECQSYHIKDRDMIQGKEVCGIVVGAKIVPNRFPENHNDYVYVWYTTDTLTIDFDDVMQVYRIKSASVIPF